MWFRVTVLLLLLTATIGCMNRKHRMCPGGLRCLETNTCCPTSLEGQFACCAYANASCCPDKWHCCAEGYTCDEVYRRCVPPQTATSGHPIMMILSSVVRRDHSMPLTPLTMPELSHEQHLKTYKNSEIVEQLTKEIKSEEKVSKSTKTSLLDKINNRPYLKKSSKLAHHKHVFEVLDAAISNGTKLILNPCPDRSVCEDHQTCCPFPNGQYGCCPFEYGVCCSDHISCCPDDTTCTDDHRCRPNDNHHQHNRD